MRNLTWVPPVATLAAALAGAMHLPAQVVVGENTQVSKDRPNTGHYELLAGASSHDARRMMACSYVLDAERNRGTSNVYTTADGGKTWKLTLSTEQYKDAGDPVCTFGKGNDAFFVILSSGGSGAGDSSKTIVFRSRDGGVTWLPGPTLMPIIDRENLVVDETGGKYDGRIYVNGTGTTRLIDGAERATGVFLFRSTDGGASFYGPVIRSTALGKDYVIGMGPSVVLSDGTVVTLFGHVPDYARIGDEGNRPGSANTRLSVVVSTDGGESYGNGIVVSDWYMARTRSQGSHIPWLAADPGSAVFKDRLYAVWDDFRTQRLEVLLSYSSDKGKTWSAPVRVGDDRVAPDPEQGPDQVMPLVSVNKDGAVLVAWYDRREQRDNMGWDLRVAASFDGGETFTPSTKVSSKANVFGGQEMWPVGARVSGGGQAAPGGLPAAKAGTPLTIGVSVNSFFVSPGHTSGLVVDASGVFHPVWQDNRTGVSQLWTSPVTAKGTVARNGGGELAQFADVTGKIGLELSNTLYDRATNTLTVAVKLKNTSKDTIVAPVKLRAVGLRSDLGLPSAEQAENGVRGVGAVWDFSSVIPANGLKPNETSTGKRLAFRLTDQRPLRQGKTFKFGLIEIDARVLAKGARGSP